MTAPRATVTAHILECFFGFVKTIVKKKSNVMYNLTYIRYK